MRSILLSVLSRPVANNLLAFDFVMVSVISFTFLPKESLARPLSDHLSERQIEIHNRFSGLLFTTSYFVTNQELYARYFR